MVWCIGKHLQHTHPDLCFGRILLNLKRRFWVHFGVCVGGGVIYVCISIYIYIYIYQFCRTSRQWSALPRVASCNSESRNVKARCSDPRVDAYLNLSMPFEVQRSQGPGLVFQIETSRTDRRAMEWNMNTVV